MKLSLKSWILIGLVSLCYTLAGCFNGNMDTVQFHFSKSSYAEKGNDIYYNPAISWKNKYVTDEDGKLVRENGELVPRFFLSTTALVFLTDFWHFQQFLMLTIFTLACIAAIYIEPLPGRKLWVVLLWLIGLFVLFKLCFSLGFHLTYV